jgi:hypothetical protein
LNHAAPGLHLPSPREFKFNLKERHMRSSNLFAVAVTFIVALVLNSSAAKASEMPSFVPKKVLVQIENDPTIQAAVGGIVDVKMRGWIRCDGCFFFIVEGSKKTVEVGTQWNRETQKYDLEILN